MNKSFKIILPLIWRLFLLQSVLIVPGSYAQKAEKSPSQIAAGDEALRSRLYSEALRLYETASAESPILNSDQSFLLKRAMSSYHIGDYGTAMPLLSQAKSSGSAYRDYIEYYQALSLLNTGQREAAVSAFSNILKTYPGTLLKNESAYYAGILLQELKKYPESNDYLLPFETDSGLSAGKTVVKYHIGLNYILSGSERTGVSRLLDIISTSPSDTLALKSGIEIIRLRNVQNTPLSENETVLIASTYINHNKLHDARRLLENYFNLYPGGVYTGRAHFERGRILFNLKRYTEAAEEFTTAFSLLKDPKLIRASRLYIARSMYGSRNYAQTEIEYDRYSREYPLDRKAAESLWIIALNYERRNQLLKAIEAYRKVAQKNSPNNYRFRALFKIGFCWYKNNNHAESSQYFKELQSRYPGTSLAIQAAFWEAKSLENLGKPEEAVVIFNNLARRKELNYHVVTARQKTGGAFVREKENISLEFDSNSDELRSIVIIGLVFGDPWGVRELKRFRNKSVVTRDILIDIYSTYVAMGSFDESIRLADFIYNRYYYGTNNTVLTTLYPRHFLNQLESISDFRRVDENFIFGIIRRESLFGAQAVSSAGAIGLMQLMPATAKTLALSLKLVNFSVNDTFRPDINMMLGIRNIRELMQRFRGSKPLAAAAYNAGDSAVRTWIDRYGTEDMDVFIENIEYSETRTFVKEVLKNHYVYSNLYGSNSTNNQDND